MFPTDLQITGKVVEVLEERSGTGKNGPWRKGDFILESEGRRYTDVKAWKVERPEKEGATADAGLG